MIGIIDYNFIPTKRGVAPPSLDAMKMSAYLKTTQKDEVRLITNLDQAAACTKVYYFCECTLDKLPKEVFLQENVELYGDYFEKLQPIVEHTLPDITLYNDVIQEKMTNSLLSTSKALTFLDSFYYKAYGNSGERLPLPPSCPRKRFYLYDKDFLGKEDCWEILDDIVARNPSSIYTTQPIQCHTVKQFFLLREEYEKVSRGNKIILDYFVPLHHFETYFGKYKLKLLGEITKTSDVCIYLGKNYSNNAYGETFYIKNLFYCLNLIFSYWSRNIPIRAEMFYPENEINPYADIYSAIRIWTNNDNYDLKLNDSFNSKKLQERKEELLKKNSLFAPFFDKSKNDLINTRGFWRIP